MQNKLTAKQWFSKVLANSYKELKQYLNEFYASASFGIRITIIVLFCIIVVSAVVAKKMLAISTLIGFLMWFGILVLVLLVSHFLSTRQKIALIVITILLFWVLVKQHNVLVFGSAYAFFRISSTYYSTELKAEAKKVKLDLKTDSKVDNDSIVNNTSETKDKPSN